MDRDKVYFEFKEGRKVNEPFKYKLTKPLAKEILKGAIDLPDPKPKYVNAYKSDMNEGKWDTNYEVAIPIDFETDRLIDGPNRLHAFIESDLEELELHFVFVNFDFNPKIIIQH